MSMQICFNDVNEVKEFVNLMGAFQGDADLNYGKYDVDAKSILGVFSIGLGKPIQLTVYDELPEEFHTKLQKFAYRAIA